MTEKIFTLKTLLKTKAAEIRKTRALFKDCQRKGTYLPVGTPDRSALRHWYRHHHIAYCLMRGTPYELIEKPAEDNKPDMDFIERIKHEYVVQDVCADAA